METISRFNNKQTRLNKDGVPIHWPSMKLLKMILEEFYWQWEMFTVYKFKIRILKCVYSIIIILIL